LSGPSSSSQPSASGPSAAPQGASGSSSPGSSSSQQETCAAVQRYRNDIVSGSDVGVLVADLKTAGEAANRGFDSTLGASLLEASTAVAQYNVNDASTRDAFLQARKAVVDATAKCDAAGSGSG
jgi:hypothetical protein